MKWAYGITTIPKRLELLTQTQASLANAGFPGSKVFVDRQKAGVIGNWLLAATDLFVHNPNADRFAIFQDDLVACKNLRAYLENTIPSLPGGYYNLLLLKSEGLDPKKDHYGWYTPRRQGQGAVALVFDNYCLTQLLTSPGIIERMKRFKDGLDGAIHGCLAGKGIKEYVHWPSLVDHVGEKSTLGHGQFPRSDSFPGVDFDAMSLIARHQ